MIGLIITTFALAIIAALFGFGGIASSLVGIGKILFFVFLVIAVISLIYHLIAPKGSSDPTQILK